MSTSIDPGQLLEALRADSIVVLDFDGVLADASEDEVYRLPVEDGPGEREFLDRAAQAFGTKYPNYSTPYLRHIVYQEAARRLEVPVARGPFVAVAEHCDTHAIPWYIISARSGTAAVARLNEFLDAQALQPTEIFMVGEKISKVEQLRRIAANAPGRTIYFVDDSDTHVADAQRANVGGVKALLWKSAGESIQSAREWKSIVERAMKADEKLDDVYKLILDNGLRQFTHYATQRNIYIRFYLTLLAALITGFFATDAVLARQAIVLIGLLTTLIFWGFDVRNVQLVRAAEGSISMVEKWLSDRVEPQVGKVGAKSAQILVATDDLRGLFKTKDGKKRVKWGYGQLVAALLILSAGIWIALGVIVVEWPDQLDAKKKTSKEAADVATQEATAASSPPAPRTKP